MPEDTPVTAISARPTAWSLAAGRAVAVRAVFGHVAHTGAAMLGVRAPRGDVGRCPSTLPGLGSLSNRRAHTSDGGFSDAGPLPDLPRDTPSRASDGLLARVSSRAEPSPPG
jgi:hypothetical protein